MKKTIFKTIILSLSCALLSCSNSSYETEESPYYYTPEDYKDIEDELQKASFYCEGSEHCPENVGLIFSNIDGKEDSPSIGQCTGFLIAEDIVATNSHCIPDRIKADNSACESQIAIKFINSSNPNIFGCQEILNYSLIEGLANPDYAFFRIKKTGREPFMIHKGGLKDAQPIRVAKVTPLSDRVGGILQIGNCKVGLGSLLNLKGTNSWSSTGLGLGCEAVNGNSGSPVLNDEGLVIGILQSKMTDTYRKVLEASFKSFNIDMPSYILPHMLFTSFSCIADPVTGSYNQEKCSYGESLSITDCISFENETNNNNIKRLMDRWKNSLPSIFIYEFISQEKDQMTTAFPICVKPRNKYADYDQYVVLKGFIGFRKEKLSLYYPHALLIGTRLTVDHEYRIQPEVQFSETKRINYSVELVKENGLWQGTENSTFSDFISGIDFTKIKIPLSLPDCTDEQMNSKEVSKIKRANGVIIDEQEYIQQ